MPKDRVEYKAIIVPIGMKIRCNFGEIRVVDHLPDNINIHPKFVDRIEINTKEEVDLHHDCLSSNMRFMRPNLEEDGHYCWRPVWTGHACMLTENPLTLHQLIYEHLHIPLCYDVNGKRWFIDETGFDKGDYYHWNKNS